MTWDRIQRLELDLAQAERKNRDLEAMLARAESISTDPSLAPIKTAAVLLITSLEDQRDQAREERDRARSTAVRLEQELAHVEDQLRVVHAQADRMMRERDRFAAASGVLPVEGSVWLLEEEVESD